MAIKAVLFDFDGTLANSIPLILAGFHHACQMVLGRDLEDAEIISTFGLPLPASMAKLAGLPEGTDIVDRMRAEYREFNDIHHDEMITPMPGAVEALRSLKAAGYGIAVVTSKKNPMCHRGLRCCDLEQYVDAVVAFGDTTHGKPHPEPMEVACRMLGVQPCETISVGDSPFDLISGKSAGALTAAVSYTTYDWQKLLEQGSPDYVLDDLGELLGLLERINGMEKSR